MPTADVDQLRREFNTYKHRGSSFPLIIICSAHNMTCLSFGAVSIGCQFAISPSWCGVSLSSRTHGEFAC